ncbi:MAG: flagellar basal body-associated FliL family protein [Alphaproteobacteria bacterium]
MAFDDDDDDGEGEPKKSIIGKRLILILVAVAVIIIGAVLGIAYMMGWLDDLFNLKPQTIEEAALERGDAPVNDIGFFYSLEEISVPIQSSGNRSRFLKLNLVLELEAESDIAFVEQVMPRITDNLLVFLRELRVSEMEGSQGIYRVREELLRRINAALSPIKIKDVLFSNIAIQ